MNTSQTLYKLRTSESSESSKSSKSQSIDSIFWFNFTFTESDLVNDKQCDISNCLIDKQILNRLKNEIGNFYNVGSKNNPWNSVSSNVYPYKLCISNKKISRAYYKLKEVITQVKKKDLLTFSNSNVLCLCEAPGGFVEYLTEEEKSTVMAVSLGENIDFSYKLFPNRKCKLLYKNILTDNISLGSYSIITADGGIDSSSNYDLQEIDNSPLIIKEIEVACKHLNTDGIFIIKAFDIYLLISFRIIIWLSKLFKEISICKPPSSKPTNSEKYIICKGYCGRDSAVSFDNVKLKENFIPNKLIEITLFSTQLQINNIKKVLSELYIPTSTNWGIIHRENYNIYNKIFKS